MDGLCIVAGYRLCQCWTSTWRKIFVFLPHDHVDLLTLQCNVLLPCDFINLLMLRLLSQHISVTDIIQRCPPLLKNAMMPLHHNLTSHLDIQSCKCQMGTIPWCL